MSDDAPGGWDGLCVDGLGGKVLGRISGIHVDAGDGKPRWALLRLGPLAGSTAIPFEHVAKGADRLWAPYEHDWVREAPRFRPHESLTAIQELELCAHWGILEGRGRAAEVAELDADQVTAVPVEPD
jgi:PRC-barrel domain